jgi:hypothetical protein
MQALFLNWHLATTSAWRHFLGLSAEIALQVSCYSSPVRHPTSGRWRHLVGNFSMARPAKNQHVLADGWSADRHAIIMPGDCPQLNRCRTSRPDIFTSATAWPSQYAYGKGPLPGLSWLPCWHHHGCHRRASAILEDGPVQIRMRWATAGKPSQRVYTPFSQFHSSLHYIIANHCLVSSNSGRVFKHVLTKQSSQETPGYWFLRKWGWKSGPSS